MKSKPQLEELPSYAVISPSMIRWLEANSPAILESLRFHEEHGCLQECEGRFDDQIRCATQDLLSELAGILTQAAVIATAFKPAVMRANLEQVQRTPSLLFDGVLPAAVEKEVAAFYQRHEERRGAFWFDVVRDLPKGLPEPRNEPTEEAVSEASNLAIQAIDGRARRGRPPNHANQFLAERLGEIFLRYGGTVERKSELSAGEMQIESGAFYLFVQRVIEPLNEYLLAQRSMPVSASKIGRLAQVFYR